MAFDFKKLSDVEVVAEPTESANVLIEEDGVIKKAPKTAVGGNSKWDAVIVIDDVYNINSNTARFVSGNFDTILAKIEADDLPKVLLITYYNYGDDCKSCVEPTLIQYNITDNQIDFYFVTSWGSNNYEFTIDSNSQIPSPL